jgi:hypothetical protein
MNGILSPRGREFLLPGRAFSGQQKTPVIRAVRSGRRHGEFRRKSGVPARPAIL